MSDIQYLKALFASLTASSSAESESDSDSISPLESSPSPSLSSSETRKSRPSIRKAPAQDFSLDIASKSLLTRSQSKSDEDSDRSPQMRHVFKYNIKTKQEDVLSFQSSKEIATHLQTYRSTKSTKFLGPLVLKVNQTNLSASTLWDLFNTLNLKRCKSVSLSKCENLNEATFNILSVQIKRLKHLDLSGVKFQTLSDQIGLAKLILKNKDSLENINLSGSNLNHKVLEAILQCSQLKSLDLSGCYYRVPDLENFAETGEAGTHNFAQETEAEYLKTQSQFPLTLFRSCLKLQHLNLSTFLAPFDHTEVTNYLKSEGLQLPLRTFICDQIKWLDATTLQDLMQYCPRLETLSLNGTGNLTSLPYYASSLPHLKQLSLSGQNKIPLDLLESDDVHVTKLESLDLSSCETFVSLKLASLLVKKGHNLKNLNLDIKTFPYARLLTVLKGFEVSQTEQQQYERLQSIQQLLSAVLNDRPIDNIHLSPQILLDLILEIKYIPALKKHEIHKTTLEKLEKVAKHIRRASAKKELSNHDLLNSLQTIQTIIKNSSENPQNLKDLIAEIFAQEEPFRSIVSKHLKSMTTIQLPHSIKGVGGQLKSLTIPVKFMTAERTKEILSLCPQLEFLNGCSVKNNQVII